jgi:cytochrome c-type biogenesis protein CcmE
VPRTWLCLAEAEDAAGGASVGGRYQRDDPDVQRNGYGVVDYGSVTQCQTTLVYGVMLRVSTNNSHGVIE